LADEVEGVSDERIIILCFKVLSVLDASGADLLTRMLEEFHERGIVLLFKSMSSQHRKIFSAITDEGVIDNHFFDGLPTAIAHARTYVHQSLAAHDDTTVWVTDPR